MHLTTATTILSVFLAFFGVGRLCHEFLDLSLHEFLTFFGTFFLLSAGLMLCSFRRSASCFGVLMRCSHRGLGVWGWLVPFRGGFFGPMTSRRHRGQINEHEASKRPSSTGIAEGY